MKLIPAEILKLLHWFVRLEQRCWNVTTPKTLEMLKEHHELATSIRDYPQDKLRAHFNRIYADIERGTRILRDLKAAGYVIIRPRKYSRNQVARPGLIAILTPAGHSFLKNYEAWK